MHGLGSRLEDVARTLTDRRLSRRAALAQGAGGIAAGATALAGLHAATAQEASPEAAAGEKTMYLFVQSFQSGSITPSTSEFGTHTITLEQGWGQTIYFADRPSRDVGASPTVDFLNGLGFEPDNPPNAALIVETAPGETDVAVVELVNPTYDEATHTATYDIAVLANWQDAGGEFREAPVDLDQLASSFGTTHLLIDDCPDGPVRCFKRSKSNASLELVGRTGVTGWCWRGVGAGCVPCLPDYHDSSQPISRTVEYWSKQCNYVLADKCKGNCTIWLSFDSDITPQV